MLETERKPATDISLNEDYIDLWAIVQMLWKRRLLIAVVTGIGTIVSVFIALALPRTYVSTATIMPADSSNDRLSQALSSLGALGGLASQAGLGLKGSVSDKFVALLKSRSVAENVISRHALFPLLFPERWDVNTKAWKAESTLPWSKNEPPTIHSALRLLKNTVKASADPKSGMIEISVKHRNPETAAVIANSYVIELNSFLQGNSLTRARQNRAFLEYQLKNAKQDLSETERSLKSFQEENKLVSLDAQAQAAVQAHATLKAQLIAKEMELGIQERSAPEGDLQLLGLRQEITQLKDKLASLETGNMGGMVSFKDAPTLGMRFAQLTREVLVRQTVYELLTQQFELAKIEVAKEDLSFQVIDKAVPPDKPSAPKRSFIVILGWLASLGSAGFAAILLEKVQARQAAVKLKSAATQSPTTNA